MEESLCSGGQLRSAFCPRWKRFCRLMRSSLLSIPGGMLRHAGTVTRGCLLSHLGTRHSAENRTHAHRAADPSWNLPRPITTCAPEPPRWKNSGCESRGWGRGGHGQLLELLNEPFGIREVPDFHLRVLRITEKLSCKVLRAVGAAPEAEFLEFLEFC